MRHKELFFAIFLIGLLALLFPVFAQANTVPEYPPKGRNINPGEEMTMVQMVKEEILIDVAMTRDVFMYNWGDPWEGYIVAYNCTFWMVNQGTETENLGVRFPLNTYYEHGKINIHSIKVNDQAVPWVEVEIEDFDIYDWARFDAVFPPGEEVEIKITYTTLTCVYTPCGVGYTLETGAGWYGPIAQGRIILRLPYQATEKNVFVENHDPTEYSFSEYDIYWDFTNLEPTSEDNWGVGIVPPDIWLVMLTELDRLEESPNNTAALYRLANYISISTIWQWSDDSGITSRSLYDEGLEAILRAVSLNPEDVEGHELYIRYLRADESLENLLLILDEIETILELDPDNDYVGRIRNYAIRRVESYHTATARAIATATNAPTATSTPTATQILKSPIPTNEPVQESLPAVTSNQSNTPEVKGEPPASGSGITFCVILVSIGAILLVFGGMIVSRAVNKKKE